MSSTVTQISFDDKNLSERWARVKDDFWHDLKISQQKALEQLLNTTMDIQVQDLIGTRRWEHDASRFYYRNGYRTRSLLTSFGFLAKLKVPRLRNGKIRFNCIPHYKRRTHDVDTTILDMFLAGVSTRRVHEVIEPLWGPGMISASGVSRITTTLNTCVNDYHTRPISDQYLYLFVDGIYLNVKNPVWKKRRCVLVAYGISKTGVKELIDFQLAPHGESQASWERFLTQLYHRGLTGSQLRLVIRDGHKGLKNALATVFPFAQQQHCWAHKMRNVANKLPKHLHDACIAEARTIYNAPDYYTALKTFNVWARQWKQAAPAAVKCLNEDIHDLLHFLREPAHLRIKLRTSNIIERSFREVRRRTRTISCFQNSDSVQRIIYAIFFRLNKQWESKPLKITHFS